MKYALNDKPKKRDMFLYGLQWFSVTIPSLVVLSGIVSNLYIEDPNVTIVYLQKCFFITGLLLISQILYGHKMPVVVGPATILLIGLASVQNISFDASFTTIAIGGGLIFLISFSKIFHLIQRFFTVRVIAVTMILVAIAMMPLIISLSKGTVGSPFFNMGFVFILTLLMIFANYLLKGIAKSLVILLGMILGSIVYISIMGTSESFDLKNIVGNY